MVGLAVIAGLLVIGLIYDVFSFDGALDGVLADVANARLNDDDEPDPVTVEGSNAQDQIDGSEDEDVIIAGNGADTVSAGSGDDMIEGGSGADRLFGDNGADTILGGDGDDFMNGRSGDDVLYGGEGQDTMRGGIGNDILFGYQDTEANLVFEYQDQLDPDRIYGNEGDDTIVAGSGDTVTGGDGNDSITLGSWIDPNNPVYIEDYQAGEDSLYLIIPEDYSGAARVTVEPSADGNHSGTVFLDGVRVAEITGANTQQTLRASQVEILRNIFEGTNNPNPPDDPADNAPEDTGDTGSAATIEGGGGNDSIDGTDLEDVIDARGGDDSVRAGAGDDLVLGGGGSDYLFGDNGADTLAGGDGDDFMNGRSGDDQLLGGTGEDTLRGGIGNDFLFGYQDDIDDQLFADRDMVDPDRIYGNQGDDIIVAGSGDTVTGGTGNDWFTLGSWVDPANPVHIEDYEAGQDAIYIFVPDDYSGAARVTVQNNPAGNQSGTVLLDGVRVAEVTGTDELRALSASQILVVRSEMFS